MTVKQGFTVFWLDGQGFVFRTHYFEAADFISAYRRALHKRFRHGEKTEISGMLVTEAHPDALVRFFQPGIYSVKNDFVEVESHLYAPKHLLR